MPSVRLQCYIPLRLADQFRRVADARGVSASSLIRDLIDAEVARFEVGAGGPMARLDRDVLYVAVGMDALLSAHKIPLSETAREPPIAQRSPTGRTAGQRVILSDFTRGLSAPRPFRLHVRGRHKVARSSVRCSASLRS